MLADPSRPGLGLPLIVRMTVPQLRDAIRGAIDTLQAEAAERRARRFRAERRVRCEAGRDGTATVSAELAIEAAAAVWNALTASAKAAQAGGDPRTLDQLRADELVARATGTPRRPPSPDDNPDRTTDADRHDPADRATATPPPLLPWLMARPRAVGATAMTVRRLPARPGPAMHADAAARGAGDAVSGGAGGACPGCGLVAGGAGGAPAGRAGRALSVSLTLPLASYLHLVNDPGRLDGYGPVAAGLARQIIAESARSAPGGLGAITWRCVVVDDVHRTVLGVGAPIKVPRHDPPPRLADLARTIAPTCCFPGCRIRARDCDLDHRIPYQRHDPGGERGGGATCSCNLQPLCRAHHRLKTAGLINVRVLTDPDADARPRPDARDGSGGAGGPGMIPGTLEWTTRTGLRYRQPPCPATPAPPDLQDPVVAAAIAHAAITNARDAAEDAATHADMATRRTGASEAQPEYDAAHRSWLKSLADYTRHRIRQDTDRTARTRHPLTDPPF